MISTTIESCTMYTVEKVISLEAVAEVVTKVGFPEKVMPPMCFEHKYELSCHSRHEKILQRLGLILKSLDGV